MSQTPKAGEKAEEDSEVTILVAVGNGKVDRADVVGKTATEAEKTLREAGLTLGQATPQPADPKAKIASQIPPRRRSSRRARRSTSSSTVPARRARATARPAAAAPTARAAAVAAAAARAAPVKVPEIDGAAQDAYAQKVGDAGSSRGQEGVRRGRPGHAVPRRAGRARRSRPARR